MKAAILILSICLVCALSFLVRAHDEIEILKLQNVYLKSEKMDLERELTFASLGKSGSKQIGRN